MRLLVVDDSAIARKFLIKSLPKGIDFDIREASNGADGIKVYTDFNPDLVFLDLTMPIMDGEEALEKLKEIDPEAVVYVLTADIQKNTYEREWSLALPSLLKSHQAENL